ncbi:hypothetical protein D9758_013357 [Tetrapyrgos nigripes]|uniref:Cytochrome P450 n=1 Tax=Tetrapyrgos nigripes TaxID=182062 RepID=A0A8H5CK80_9AGAR|nr:hypothetical protein D9758_013357 [Tetrapyrgos nigripes]
MLSSWTQPDTLPSLLFVVCGLSFFIVLHRKVIRKESFFTTKLDNIPGIGWSGALASYLTAIRFLYDAQVMLENGYRRHHNSAFKIPFFDKWVIVFSDENKIQDIRRASNEQLSATVALQELMHFDFSLGAEISEDPYHVAVITRFFSDQKMRLNFAGLLDEVETALSEQIPINKERAKINAWELCRIIMFQSQSRLFVGVPLCRKKEYMSLNTQYAVAVMLSIHIMRCIPKFLHKPIRRYLSPFPGYIQKMTKLLQDHAHVCSNTQEQRDSHSPENIENVFLTALAQATESHKNILSEMSMRLLAINFVSNWTSSLTLNFALSRLALSPDLVPVLRQEVETCITLQGWSHASINNMYLLDSFIKESQRLSGVVGISLTRKAMKDFTFSDGTQISKGTLIAFPVQAIHYDEKNYNNARSFQPWRFAQDQDNPPPQASPSPMTSPDTKFLEFGIGRHTW